MFEIYLIILLGLAFSLTHFTLPVSRCNRPVYRGFRAKSSPNFVEYNIQSMLFWNNCCSLHDWTSYSPQELDQGIVMAIELVRLDQSIGHHHMLSLNNQ